MFVPIIVQCEETDSTCSVCNYKSAIFRHYLVPSNSWIVFNQLVIPWGNLFVPVLTVHTIRIVLLPTNLSRMYFYEFPIVLKFSCI